MNISLKICFLGLPFGLILYKNAVIIVFKLISIGQLDGYIAISIIPSLYKFTNIPPSIKRYFANINSSGDVGQFYPVVTLIAINIGLL